MKPALLALVSLCCLPLIAGAEEPGTALKAGLEVYLLIGQSNMAGRAPFGEEEAKPVEHCFLLTDKGQWEPATNPLNRHSSIRKGLGMQKMNPGYGFAQTMLRAKPQQEIGLVVNARGGTSINQWGKGTKYYNEALRRAKEAQQSGTLKGILWHQGESDAAQPEGYAEKLKALVEGLRQDLGAPDAPVVAGKVFAKPATEKINEELGRVPTLIPNAGCVSVDGLGSGDKTHFDTAGMKLLGQRYAEEMLRLQAAKK